MAAIATILLAAGDSTRMGAHKGLLPFGDRSVIEELSARALDAGSDIVRVCVAEDVAQGLACTTVPRTRILVVPEVLRSRGPIGSIRHGLTAPVDSTELDSDARRIRAWLLWPVDHPFVATSTLRALLETDGEVRIPVHDERRGHPLVVAGSARLALLAATERVDTTLRDFVRAQTHRVRFVTVADEAILWNCDDRARFEQGYDRFVSN